MHAMNASRRLEPVGSNERAATHADLVSVGDVLRQQGLSHWMRLALLLALKAESGNLTVTVLDGRSFRIGGRLPGPQAALLVRDQTVARRILTGGNLSFAEAYLEGKIDSPDLTAVVEWVSLNQAVEIGRAHV